MTDLKVEFAPHFFETFKFAEEHGSRFIVFAGGRGTGKSWHCSLWLVVQAMTKENQLILCSREIKSATDLSSKKTIERMIEKLGVKKYFTVYKTTIVCKATGSKFIFTGLSTATEDSVKSTESVNIAWIGEAQSVSESSLMKLFPTIREEGSQIIIDLNPEYMNTPVYKYFVEDVTEYPPRAKRSFGDKIAFNFSTFKDNPWFPTPLVDAEKNDRQNMPEHMYKWVWLGYTLPDESKYLMSEILVRRAMKRKLLVPKYVQAVVGVDCARQGGDENAMYMRKGKKVIKWNTFSGRKIPRVIMEIERFVDWDRDVKIRVDGGSFGAAVCDELEERGYDVDMVNFGGRPRFDVKYNKDCATDMAFHLVDLIPDIDIPEDPILLTQCTTRAWEFVEGESGKRRLESKEKYKKNAVSGDSKSPDRFDALMLCFYDDIDSECRRTGHKTGTDKIIMLPGNIFSGGGLF